ncbi:F0F1 ATP synthase subunit B [Opitutae bacterium]|nr:F0F1 ATP synthase subunit B [Opitutae bacterium]
MYKFISICLFSLFLTLGLLAEDASIDGVLPSSESKSTTLVEEPGRIEAVAKKFGVTWPTLIAQMVNFLLVTFVLYKFAIKPILATYDERQKKIADGLQYAEEMKEQLLEAEKDRLEKIKEAVEEAQKILGDARDQSKAMLEQKIQEATAQAEGLIRKAGEATELERQKMLAEVKSEVARLVVETTARVLDKELSLEDKERYSNAAAENLSSNLS